MMKSKLKYLENSIPKFVVTPTFLIMIIFVYGFIMWNFVLSLTNSKLLPMYNFVGFKQYIELFGSSKWWLALENLFIFSSLFIASCIAIGLLLAIFIDQKIRFEGVFRTIYLYPMALSFIATGTIWQWMLNPGLGLQKFVVEMGFKNFTFDWLVDTKMAIYTIVIAAVWQSTGFVMILLLAGLRGINGEVINAAKIDGASMPKIYWKIIIPQLRPVFFSSIIILLHIAIKTFDLVVVMTKGGPGYSTILPSIFMYQYSFSRNKLAYGASSAMIMLLFVMIFVVPYLYNELRKR
ncbi:MAG: sugar ABC transporter permease [Epsilonproteobacteria bacterium]|nr:sugar ABC transporter permease [Campylobacterota bacterium]